MDLNFANPIFGLFFLMKVLITAKTMFKYQKSPDQISIPDHVQKHSGTTGGDLNMTPFKFRRRQFLSEAVRVKRRDRGRCLLKWMDRWPRVPFIWSDEKVFTIEQDFNHPE